MPDVAPPRKASYVPTGYCPACGYPCDPGRCAECGRDVKRPLRRDPRAGVGRLLRIARTVAVTIGLLSAVGYGALAWAYRYVPDDAVSAAADSEVSGLSSIAIDIIAWRWAEHDRRLIEHENRIRAEIAATPGHPWAGEYRTFESWVGGLIVVAPHGGAAEYWFSGCGFGRRSGPDFAGLLQSDTGSELCFAETLHGWQTVTASCRWFAIIRWGPRRCLVHAEFFAGASAYPLPIHHFRDHLYVRPDELQLPFVGSPELPVELREYVDLRWTFVAISGVRATTGERDEYGIRTGTVLCDVNVRIPDRAMPVGLFAALPIAKVLATDDDGATLLYTVMLSDGEALIEPQVGWQFAYDWDDDAEDGEAEFVDSDSSRVKANQDTP